MRPINWFYTTELNHAVNSSRCCATQEGSTAYSASSEKQLRRSSEPREVSQDRLYKELGSLLVNNAPCMCSFEAFTNSGASFSEYIVSRLELDFVIHVKKYARWYLRITWSFIHTKVFPIKTHTEYSGKTLFNNMTRQLTSWMIFNLDSASPPLALIMKFHTTLILEKMVYLCSKCRKHLWNLGFPSKKF